MKPTTTNAPVKTLRNRRIKAAIWENHGAKGVFYTVTISRSFKQNDAWRDSHSFSHTELLLVAKLMYDAHTAISALLEKEKQSRSSSQAAPQSSVRQRAKV
jgi:hypothetical protein